MAGQRLVAEAVHNKLKNGTGVVIKCPKCGHIPEDGESLLTRGWGKVEGGTVWSYDKGFEGIDWWETQESDNEEVLCPACGKYSSLGGWGFYDL